MARTLLIVNPIAGCGAGRRIAPKLADALIANGDQVKRAETNADDGARSMLTGELAEWAERVVVLGGDGTVFNVLQSLPRSCELSVVPLGTGNVLAKQLRVFSGGMVKRWAVLEDALPILTSSHSHTIDLMQVNQELAASCVVSAGFDGYVVRELEERRRARPMHILEYLGLGLRALRHPLTLFELVCDGVQISKRATWVNIANVSAFGGPVCFQPQADPSDGWLDVIWAESRSRAEMLSIYAHALVAGCTRHKAVRRLRAKSIELLPLAGNPEVLAQADGEGIGPLPVSVEVQPRALRVLARQR